MSSQNTKGDEEEVNLLPAKLRAKAQTGKEHLASSPRKISTPVSSNRSKYGSPKKPPTRSSRASLFADSPPTTGKRPSTSPYSKTSPKRSYGTRQQGMRGNTKSIPKISTSRAPKRAATKKGTSFKKKTYEEEYDSEMEDSTELNTDDDVLSDNFEELDSYYSPRKIPMNNSTNTLLQENRLTAFLTRSPKKPSRFPVTNQKPDSETDKIVNQEDEKRKLMESLGDLNDLEPLINSKDHQEIDQDLQLDNLDNTLQNQQSENNNSNQNNNLNEDINLIQDKMEVEINNSNQQELNKEEILVGEATSANYLNNGTNWCIREWFYPDIDVGFFSVNEFEQQLNHLGLPQVKLLTRLEWGVIRTQMGRPRRFSQPYLDAERKKLAQYRGTIQNLRQTRQVTNEDLINLNVGSIPTLPVPGSQVLAICSNSVENKSNNKKNSKKQNSIISTVKQGTVTGISTENNTVSVHFSDQLQSQTLSETKIMSIQHKTGWQADQTYTTTARKNESISQNSHPVVAELFPSNENNSNFNTNIGNTAISNQNQNQNQLRNHNNNNNGATGRTSFFNNTLIASYDQDEILNIAMLTYLLDKKQKLVQQFQEMNVTATNKLKEAKNTPNNQNSPNQQETNQIFSEQFQQQLKKVNSEIAPKLQNLADKEIKNPLYSFGTSNINSNNNNTGFEKKNSSHFHQNDDLSLSSESNSNFQFENSQNPFFAAEGTFDSSWLTELGNECNFQGLKRVNQVLDTNNLLSNSNLSPQIINLISYCVSLILRIKNSSERTGTDMSPLLTTAVQSLTTNCSPQNGKIVGDIKESMANLSSNLLTIWVNSNKNQM